MISGAVREYEIQHGIFDIIPPEKLVSLIEFFYDNLKLTISHENINNELYVFRNISNFV